MYKVIKLLIIIVCFYTVHTVVETYLINRQLSDFKNRAEYKYTLDNINIYEVTSNVSTNTGDILLSRKSGNPNLVLRDIISFYVGGHAALVINEDETLEVFGNLDKENIVKKYENDWIETELEVIGLKINGDHELRYNDYLNQEYNWFPIYDNPNKRYCTDLIDRIYDQVGININYDYGVITVNDIILSKETTIYLYKETVGDIVNIYYMG